MFNGGIALAVMYIDAKPVLFIVNEGTQFSAAGFIFDVCTTTTRRTLLRMCMMINTGLSNCMPLEHCSAIGNMVVDLAVLGKVEVERIGIETRSSLGPGERYHQRLTPEVLAHGF